MYMYDKYSKTVSICQVLGIQLGKVGLYNIVEKVVKKCLDSIKMIIKKLFEIQKKITEIVIKNFELKHSLKRSLVKRLFW